MGEFLVCRMWQSFGEYISHHVSGWNPGDLDGFKLDSLLHKMVLDIYMFQAGVECRIIYDIDRAFVVTEDFSRFHLQVTNEPKEVSEPYGLL